MFNHAFYRSDSLVLVAKRENFNHPYKLPLRLGDTVSLNSDGPQAIVVDVDAMIPGRPRDDPVLSERYWIYRGIQWT